MGSITQVKKVKIIAYTFVVESSSARHDIYSRRAYPESSTQQQAKFVKNSLLSRIRTKANNRDPLSVSDQAVDSS